MALTAPAAAETIQCICLICISDTRTERLPVGCMLVPTGVHLSKGSEVFCWSTGAQLQLSTQMQLIIVHSLMFPCVYLKWAHFYVILYVC
jgi:hypothetical protein